jgi:cytidylate kinase
MNISSNEILPLPDEDELLHGKRYYQVDIENLKPQDLVIKYNRNNRNQEWIEILENPSEPGFINRFIY